MQPKETGKGLPQTKPNEDVGMKLAIQNRTVVESILLRV